MKKGIVVIGSANWDVVNRVPHIPAPGETISSRGMMMNEGGKGANQAVAAARLGAEVHMIACVGADKDGERMLESLSRSGVNTSGIRGVENMSTGTAYINVSDDGENCIVVLAGANAQLDTSRLDEQDELLKNAHIVINQLEVPLETVWESIYRAHRYGAITVLNPSPVHAVPDEVLRCVDILIPNEVEMAAMMDGSPMTDEALSGFVRSKGVGMIVVTLGDEGCCIARPDGVLHLPCSKVHAVDTTGAGDTFLGAMAVKLDEGLPIEEAVRFAMKASAITVSRMGAQQAMPFIDEIE